MMPSDNEKQEAYSEAGLSGEAAPISRKTMTVIEPVVTGVEPIPDETEPFLLRQRSDEEVNEYDKGFECGQKGGQNDDTKSQAWQRGWGEAQE
jgi:hypothetical protein